jgi:WD40 repeat protein
MRFCIVPILFAIASLTYVVSGAPQQSLDKDQAPASSNVAGHWRDLADPDASKAYLAILALTKTPGETVPYLAGQLKPAAAPDPRTVEQLIDQLNSATFAVRENATHELTRMGGLAEAALKKALQAPPSLEASKRLEKLLQQLQRPLTLADQLQAVRAVETLEYIGTAQAKALLASYAEGAAGAPLTQHARDALDHWGRIDRRIPAAASARTDLYGDALPAGAVGRLGTVRFRRSPNGSFGPLGMSFLPDGKGLVTGDMQDVKVFEVPSGKLLHDLRATAYIRGFALSPRGKEFAVSVSLPDEPGQNEIQVKALPSGEVIRKFPHNTQGREQFVFSHDSQLLFSLSKSSSERDSILRIEEISTGKELAQRRFPTTDESPGIALSQDSKYLAINFGVNARQLFLWKWQDDEPRQLEADLPGRGLDVIRFSPDGKLLAGVQFAGALYVWQVSGGRLLFHKECEVEPYYFVAKAAFTPDGKTLAVALRHRGQSRGKVQVLDPQTGKSQGFVETLNEPHGLAFSADSRLLAVADGNAIRLWDMAPRTELTSHLEGHRSLPSAIVVSATGILATTGDSSVRVWDAVNSKQHRIFELTDWVRAIDLSPDGKQLAGSCFDDALHIWDMGNGREIYRLAGHGRVGSGRTLGFHADGQSLLSWGDDFYLRQWDMKTGKARLEYAIRPHGIDLGEDDDGRADRMMMHHDHADAMAPDGKTFVLKIDGHVHLFETKTGKETARWATDKRWGSMTVSPNSKLLLLSHWGDSRAGKHPVSVFDLHSGQTLLELTLPGSVGGPVAYSPDGRTFATSVEGEPREILIVEAASGKVRSTIRGVAARVWSLAYFPDGRRLASGLNDTTVVIWDLTAPEHLAKR